jgi:dipeptidyl aminopeptidase/acylaminoacyl peptidase
MGRNLVLALALLAGCGRTDLDGGLLAEKNDGTGPRPSVPDPSDPVPNEPAPVDPEPEPEPRTFGPLPEICVATHAYTGSASTAQLRLFAPFSEQPGPFTVSGANAWTFAFSPRGRRLVFLDDTGLHLVDSWPPEPRRLTTEFPASSFAFVDETHVVVNVRSSIELHDLETETRLVLHQSAAPPDPSSPPLYLVHPSPDGRWVAYAEVKNQVHELWLLDLLAEPRSPVRVMTLEPGAVAAWLDWAPDSEHLGISVTDSNRTWLRPHSAPTTGKSFDALPISFELDAASSVPTFQWSPTGGALHYLYQRVDPVTNETDWRLYFVDMTTPAPGPSVLLSHFDERNWPSPGYFSPKGDMIAFSAEFAGPDFREALFVSRVDSPNTPERQHTDGFGWVLKQEWSPDNRALYFTAIRKDGVESVYRADLEGTSTLVSSPSADVRGLYVSPKPGCLAYAQYQPTPAVVIVDELQEELHTLGDPQANDPTWTGTFDSSIALWVGDRKGDVKGFSYVSSSPNGGDGLVWIPVKGCTPSSPEVVIESEPNTFIHGLFASTTTRSGERE